MSVDAIRDLYAYHWWANRTLWDVAAGLGEAGATRAVGPQFSFPTLKGMFAHIYGADRLWLATWRGEPRVPMAVDADFPGMAALRAAWDRLEAEQAAYLETLTPEALAGTVLEYRSARGTPLRAPLRILLQHVPNHGTHHRSELATMFTVLAGSPPDTGLHSFALWRSGQSR
jgi:uncharacterized damage-inducible protein DinB